VTQRIDEQELLQRIADLPREISPVNDPWPAISARLDQRGGERASEGRARGWMPRAAAAAVVLAVVAGVLLSSRLSDPTLPGAETSVAATPQEEIAGAPGRERSGVPGSVSGVHRGRPGSVEPVSANYRDHRDRLGGPAGSGERVSRCSGAQPGRPLPEQKDAGVTCAAARLSAGACLARSK